MGVLTDGAEEAASGRLLRAGGIARVSGGTDGAADAESGMVLRKDEVFIRITNGRGVEARGGRAGE